MLPKISRLLLELHRDCREPAVEDFPRWAMELLDGAIRHDGCFWGAGNLVDGEIIAHSYWFRNVAPASMQTWEEIKHLDTICATQVQQPSRVFNWTHEAMQEEYVYRHLFKTVGIEQYLGTYVPNPATGIWDGLSLYRFDAAAPFSEEERRAFECVVPNMIEARRANYLTHIGSRRDAPEAARRHLAAADAKGVLHAIEGGFTALMRIEWPGWQGPRLPLPVGARISERSGRFLGEAIAIDFEPVLDMTLLHACRRQPVDKLSERQVAIARAFAQGASHKEVAHSLDLSPATVRNHLSAIYGTLGISSKAELATLLAHRALKAPPR